MGGTTSQLPLYTFIACIEPIYVYLTRCQKDERVLSGKLLNRKFFTIFSITNAVSFTVFTPSPPAFTSILTLQCSQY